MPKLHDEKPKLVNRGAAGLISKVKPDEKVKERQETQVEKEERILRDSPKNRVAPSLKHLLVPIDSLNPDPDNARLHPERNLRAVMLSLAQSGQRKVISVKKKGMIVMAGNGTLEAAKALGWTMIAAAVDDDLTEAEWAAYGLADNRSAELAKWDFETVARLDKLVESAGLDMVGWSIDELEVLRAADWTPPEIVDEDLESARSNKIVFTEEQWAAIEPLVEIFRQRPGMEGVSPAEAIKTICEEWSQQ